MKKIITILLILISITGIFFIQKDFKKTNEWDQNYIDLNGFQKLNKNVLIMNKLFTFGNEGIGNTLFEIKMGLDMMYSADFGLNKWLRVPENKEYFDYLLKMAGYRANSYELGFQNIGYGKITDKDNKESYSKIMEDNLKKLDLGNEIESKYYKELFELIGKEVCSKEMIKYPKHPIFEKIYRLNVASEVEKKNNKKATCFLLLNGGSSPKLSMWKGLIMLSYVRYLKDELTPEEYQNQIKDNLEKVKKMSLLLKKITLETSPKDIHRNSTLKDNFVGINQDYNKARNELIKKYLDYKNKDNE